MLPGQRELPADTDLLDPSSVVCSQIRVFLNGLLHGGNLDSLCSLWNNLGLGLRGSIRVSQFNLQPERVFVSFVCVACICNQCSLINNFILFYQGKLAYMFRELLQYSTHSIGQSGYYSLQLHSTPSSAQLVLVFWSGNVYYCVHLADSCRLLEAKKTLEAISCFLAVLSNPPVIHSLIGFDGHTVEALNTELNQIPPACSVPTFTHEDLYKVLARPTVESFYRYDIHSVLQFLLMKLRTALDLT